jgi:hypothetical protein
VRQGGGTHTGEARWRVALIRRSTPSRTGC